MLAALSKMQPYVANSYVLSVSILIAELVRQSQESAQSKHSDGGGGGEQRSVSRASLNALALFLVDELQQPMTEAADDGGSLVRVLLSV